MSNSRITLSLKKQTKTLLTFGLIGATIGFVAGIPIGLGFAQVEEFKSKCSFAESLAPTYNCTSSLKNLGSTLFCENNCLGSVSKEQFEKVIDTEYKFNLLRPLGFVDLIITGGFCVIGLGIGCILNYRDNRRLQYETLFKEDLLAPSQHSIFFQSVPLNSHNQNAILQINPKELTSIYIEESYEFNEHKQDFYRITP